MGNAERSNPMSKRRIGNLMDSISVASERHSTRTVSFSSAGSYSEDVRIPLQGRNFSDTVQLNIEVSEVTYEVRPHCVKATKRRKLLREEEDGTSKVMDGIRTETKRKMK